MCWRSFASVASDAADCCVSDAPAAVECAVSARVRTLPFRKRSAGRGAWERPAPAWPLPTGDRCRYRLEVLVGFLA